MRLRRATDGPFDIVARGFDRSQVQAYLQENQNWTTQAWERIQTLEAKVTELEEVCTASERDRKEASELAEQARVRLMESKRTGAEIIMAAEVRAAKIFDTAAHSIKRAQEEVERFSKEADTDEERISQADVVSTRSHMAGESPAKVANADENPETAELAERLRSLHSPLSFPSAPGDDPTSNGRD